MSDQIADPTSYDPRSRAQWPWFSLTLLAIYLLFFHVRMVAPLHWNVMLGIGVWFYWAAFCYRARHVFATQFEYWIHQAVGLDILIEGFNPWHAGYGFYLCAAAFWSIFLIYHYWLVPDMRRETPSSMKVG